MWTVVSFLHTLLPLYVVKGLSHIWQLILAYAETLLIRGGMRVKKIK